MDDENQHQYQDRDCNEDHEESTEPGRRGPRWGRRNRRWGTYGDALPPCNAMHKVLIAKGADRIIARLLAWVLLTRHGSHYALISATSISVTPAARHKTLITIAVLCGHAYGHCFRRPPPEWRPSRQAPAPWAGHGSH